MNPRAQKLVAGLVKGFTVPKDTHVPAERFVAALDLGRKLKRTKQAPVGVAQDDALHGLQDQWECQAYCRILFGPVESRRNGWRWRQKWRKDPELLRDILGEVRLRHDLKNPAAFAEALWKKAKGRR